MILKVEYYFPSDGSVQYKFWKNEKGQAHREDGPAFEYSNGRRIWYKNGEWHREDGPAIVFTDGRHQYYLNNELYSEEEYCEEIEKMKKERENK